MKEVVFVLDENGKPLMPTTFRRFHQLKCKGRAVVKQHAPFVIQLTPSEHKVQPISLGLDMGYPHIGFSATTEKQELICGTLEQEVNGKRTTTKRLAERAMYRRNRRNRLWYRKRRLDNRTKSRKKGWLPPSIKRNYQTHLNLINKLRKWLPISKVVVETAKFDIAKIDNPEVHNELYQQGTLYNYVNQKMYLLNKQEGKCALCNKGYNKNGWHMHHIVPRSQGGSNTVDNLVLLHQACHDKLHQKRLQLRKKGYVKKHKAGSFMNIIRKRIQKEVNCEVTFGYITSARRIEFGITKEHYNDAFVIAGGTTQRRVDPIVMLQKKINNRSLQKNNINKKENSVPRPDNNRRIRRSRSPFQSGDFVWFEGRMYRCGGSMITPNGKRLVVIGCKKSATGNDSVITLIERKIEKHFCNGSITILTRSLN